MYDMNKKVEDLANCKPARKKKKRRALSLHEEVLALVQQANAQAKPERQVVPRYALAVMSRTLSDLASLNPESQRLGALREISKFIALHQNTSKAHEANTKHADLLPVGHPLSALNASAPIGEVRSRYAAWLAADASLSDEASVLVASAYSLPPMSFEREHAFLRLNMHKTSSVPRFFKIDPIVAAFTFSGGNSSAARRARVALQWRDRKGRWVDMGRGIDFNFRLPNGDIGSAGGTYVGVNAARGYTTDRDGKPAANAGLVEIRGNDSIPDGIYSIESANATPVKARIPGKALKKAGLKRGPSTRKATPEEMQSPDIPDLQALLDSRVDSPSGWTKQDDGSFISDDDYKVIPTDSGFALHRLDKDGNTGQKVAEAKSWAEAQDFAEKDSDDYDKFKDSVGVSARIDEETRKGIEDARAARADRLAETIFERRTVDGESLEEVASDLKMPREEVRRIEADYMRKNPEKVAALRGQRAQEESSGRRVAEPKKSEVTIDFALDKDQYGEIGLDPEKDYTDDEIANAWIKAKGLENDVKYIDSTSPDAFWPGYRFEINDDAKDKFAKAYGYDNWQSLGEDLFPDDMKDQAKRQKEKEKLGNIPANVGESGELPNGIKYTAENSTIGVRGFPNRPVAQIPAVRVKLSGNTYPQRDLIKKLGFKWDAQDKVWYKSYYANEYRFEGHQKTAAAIREQLDGVGGGLIPRYPGDNNDIFYDKLQPARNNMVKTKQDNPDNPLVKSAWDSIVKAALDNGYIVPNAYKNVENNQDSRRESIKDLESFIAAVETEGFPTSPDVENAKKLAKEAIDALNEKIKAGEPQAKEKEKSNYDVARTGLIDHMNEEGTTENRAMAISEVQGLLDDAKEQMDKGNNQAAIDNLENARDILNGSEQPTDGVFPPGEAADRALGGVENLIDELKAEAGAEEPQVEEIVDVRGEEPPAVPSADGETPTKTPSPSTPSTPGLFKDFDVPPRAFQLRTTEYEPEGRVDEESTNFTDDPSRLASRFPVDILTKALVESLIGKQDDSVFDDIVEDVVGEDGDPLDYEDAYDVENTPPTQAGRAAGTGYGRLEFNAGDELVPAEALYNAVYLAGGDPNRVIANAYDAVHGDRRNITKLNDASGELPSPEEQQLVDDIVEQIRQIDSAMEDGESPVANKVTGKDAESPLRGELIYNEPIDWDNPDYYVIDSAPYEPSVPDVDENGYTDNPKILARDYVEADLIQQLNTAIADGSGAAFFDFGDEENGYDSGIYEVPVEAVRDALQYKGVNTNALLSQLKKESIDFEEEEKPEAPTAAEPESADVSYTPSIEAIVGYYGSLPEDVNLVAYLPSDGSIAFTDTWNDNIQIAKPDGSITPTNVDADWILDPNGAGQAGWRALSEEEVSEIRGEYENVEPEGPPSIFPSAPTPTPTPTPAAPPAPAAPQYVYPGPRIPGYSPDNTVRILGGAVIGKGARVQALKDYKTGVVVAVQNDPPYVRIRFDDGTTAVRSASKIRALSDASGAAPQVATEVPVPPSRDVPERLNRPLEPVPRIARSSDTKGVNDESTRPDLLDGRTNEAAVQSDFSAWRDRDAEIAKAAADRVSFAELEKAIAKYELERRIDRRSDAALLAGADVKNLVADAFGDRLGISFGGEMYTIKVDSVTSRIYSSDSTGNPYNQGTATQEDLENGKASYDLSVEFNILDVSGRVIGEGKRSIYVAKTLDDNGNVVKTKSYAKADILKLYNDNKRGTGFASAFNRWVENWYIANGLSKIEVMAAGGNGWTGGFVWALSGYNWYSEGDALRQLRALNSRASTRLEVAQVEDLQRRVDAAKLPNGDYDMSKMPTPLEFALVGWDPAQSTEKGKWIGRDVMISQGWSGVKHLDPQATEQIQAANYNQIKNARVRIKANQNIPSLSSDGLAVVDGDKFRNNPTIAPYYDQIRDVLKNNRSLAFLSPDAKNALNSYATEQLLSGGEDLPLEDVFRLRNGLINEYRADYNYSDPFNSAEVLSDFTVDDFEEAFTRGDSKLSRAGFAVRALDEDESGVNATYLVTHKASGQIFFVKNDEFVAGFSGSPAGVTELEASLIFKAAGMQGIHDVRVGKNDRNLVVMSQAGSTIPLADNAATAFDVQYNGIRTADGSIKRVDSPSVLIDNLDNPEDVIRMSIFDIMGNNEDRHNGNWMLAYDKSTGKIRMFPIDNTVGEIRSDGPDPAQFINYGGITDADVYQGVMPILIDRIGSDGMMKIYENEINRIVNNLDNPLYKPKGFEMDKIIEKWGSYDAFKDSISSRLKLFITSGSDENDALISMLRLGYWS